MLILRASDCVKKEGCQVKVEADSPPISTRTKLAGELGPASRMFEWRQAFVYILCHGLLVHLGQCDVNGGGA